MDSPHKKEERNMRVPVSWGPKGRVLCESKQWIRELGAEMLLPGLGSPGI
jgi:hypothetical protein